MDTKRWGLLRDPFCEQAVAAKPFLVNDSFRHAYRDLLAAARAARGCLLLSGERGLGKTTLLRYLLRGLPFAGIVVESFPSRELPSAAPQDVNIPAGAPADPPPAKGPEASWPAFCSRIVQRTREGRPIVLAVDDADRLPDAVLLDMLSLRNTAQRLAVPLTLLMAAAPAFASRLSALVREAGCELDVHARLVPLSEPDVAAYVAQALSRAGCRGAGPFPPASIARVALHANGTLAAVNCICARAMALAEADDCDLVTPERIDRAAAQAGYPSSPTGGHAGSPATEAEQAPPHQAVEHHVPAAHLPDAEPEANTALALSSDTSQWLVDDARDERSQAPGFNVPAPPVDRGLGEKPLARLPLLAQAKALPADMTSIDRTATVAPRRSARIAAGAAAALLLTAGVSVYAWQQLGPGQDTSPQTAGEAQRGALSVPLAASAGGLARAPAAEPSGGWTAAAPAAPAVAATPGSERHETRDDADPAAAAKVDVAVPAARVPAERAQRAVQVAQQAAAPPPVPAADMPAAGAPVAGEHVSGKPVAGAPASPPRAPMNEGEIALMLARGDEMLASSDVVSARLFYARAAGQGSAVAMTAMAGTYDPQLLGSHNVFGIRADAREAIDWYRRAIAAGDAGAGLRLNALVEEMRRSGTLSAGEAAALLRPAESLTP